MRDGARGDGAARPQPAGANARRPRLPGRLQRRPITSPRFSEFQPIGLEGLDDRLDRRHEEDEPAPAGPAVCCPKAAAGCSSSSAARRAKRATHRRARLMAALEKQAERAVDEAVRRPARRKAGLEDSRVGPRRDGPGARRADHLGRLGGFGGSAGEARRISARLAEAVRQVRLRLRRSTGISARAASTRASISISRPPPGIDEVHVVHGRRRRPRGRRTAARCRASTATASRKAQFLPKMFGPELVRSVPRVQDDLGSRRQDESRQGRRSVSHRSEPAARRRLPAARSRDALPVPAGSPQLHVHDDCAASASANAGASTAGRCARATA